MLSTTTLLRLPGFRGVLGLCLMGALSACAMESAPGDESTIGEVSEAVTEDNWMDLGKPTTPLGIKVDALDLAVSYLTLDEPDIWVIGADGQLWTRTPSTIWLALGKPGSLALTGVSAVRRGSKTDVVVTDTAGTIWYRTRSSSGTWGTWATVGSSPGQARGKPAVSQVTGDDRLDVWVRGTDDALWHAYRFGTQAWSGWIRERTPEGGLKGPPAAYTRRTRPLIIDVVARGTGNVPGEFPVLHLWWRDGWHGWEGVNLQTSDDPSVGVIGGYEVPSILAPGLPPSDDTAILARKWNNVSWETGRPFPLPRAGSHGAPVFVNNNHGDPDLYIRGSANNVWRLL